MIHRTINLPIPFWSAPHRRPLSARLFRFGTYLILWCFPLWAQAASMAVPQSNTALQSIHQDLSKHVDLQQLLRWQKAVRVIAGDAQQCITEKNSNLSQIDKSLGILGSAAAGEPKNLSALRQKLQGEQKNLQGALATCKVLAISSAELTQQIHQKREALHAAMLLRRDHNLWQQALALRSLPAGTWTGERNFWLTRNGQSVFAQENLQIAFGMGVAVFILSLLLRAPLTRKIYRQHPLPPASNTPYHSVPLLAGVITAVVATALTNTLSPLIMLSLTTWGGYLFTSTLLTLALRPSGVVSRHFNWPPQTLRSTLRRLRFIAMLAVFALAWVVTAPGDPLSLMNQDFFYSMYHLILLVAVSWLIWGAGGHKPFRIYPLLRALILLALTVTAIFTILGYRNLSNYLCFGLLTSLLAFGVGLFFSWGLADFWSQPPQPSSHWQRFLRHRLDLKDDQPLPWIAWLSAISHTFVWLGIAAFILYAWGLTHAGFTLLWKYFITGFAIGSFHVQPFRWVIAILLLILLFNINTAVQQYLSDHSRIIGHMESGARHSVLSIVRYTGFIIAVLVALSTAGVALHNFAIIAGALSVGIGFGLQNIVNNFVSGLILLLERPIRVGDWIQVGATQGYVQKMSIRYTLILTFDRTEVFVPNSELIASQVTNWMYTNQVLRLMIPFHIAHDADIPLVKKILETEGQNHPDVLQDDPRGIPPTALLLDVNENALQFCLRVYLYDCNKSFNVQTDLRASVVESLLRHRVALAHQQQDVHIVPHPFSPTDGNLAQAAGDR
uniref:Mechanosensitive ion channel n=2 Tax=Acidithiobacillus ferrianus TaxID=2678518 RepID=A0A845UPG4_9PROT|nr:mechanosensitive ion channel [Acidithiobacillus ferrianus]